MAKPTILVVDDEHLRWSLGDRLTEEGYRVVEAETTAEALEKHREGVDLVLLDYRLPESDGLTVLKRIKKTNPENLERSLVIQALERSGWNQTRAASLLGINRDQIRYRIEKFKLERATSA